MLAVIVVVLLVGLLAGQSVIHYNTVRDLRTAHAADLESRDGMIMELVAQAQANAQNMPYYPQVGPADPIEELRMLRDPSGLIEFPDYDEDDALDEVAR